MRKHSFAVSAQECTASASIDAEPVSTAATVFAIATSVFATNATITVDAPSSGASTVGCRR